MLTAPEMTLLQVFPPGRARRIAAWLARHQPEVDDLRSCGELTFHLGTDQRRHGVVSTSGPSWKPQPIEEDGS